MLELADAALGRNGALLQAAALIADAAEQGVEADEAWSTSELRSLTPVLSGHFAGGTMDDRRVRVVASVGLAVGAVLGMAGTFAPSPSLPRSCLGYRRRCPRHGECIADHLVLSQGARSCCHRLPRVRRRPRHHPFECCHGSAREHAVIRGRGQPLGPCSHSDQRLCRVPLVGAGPRILRCCAVRRDRASDPCRRAGHTDNIPAPVPRYPVFVATMAGWIWRSQGARGRSDAPERPTLYSSERVGAG